MIKNSYRYIPSPHADERPAGIQVDLLVIHAISLPPGEFGGTGVEALFLGRLDPDAHPYFRDLAKIRVSAHFFIDRLGSLTQYVPVFKRAWHAGQSLWEGRFACNDFSIGVELEGVDALPFEPVQYERLAILFATLSACLPGLTPERVVGHQQIAPGRKWDPGSGFDWNHLRILMSQAKPDSKHTLIWE